MCPHGNSILHPPTFLGCSECVQEIAIEDNAPNTMERSACVRE